MEFIVQVTTQAGTTSHVSHAHMLLLFCMSPSLVKECEARHSSNMVPVIKCIKRSTGKEEGVKLSYPLLLLQWNFVP